MNEDDYKRLVILSEEMIDDYVKALNILRKTYEIISLRIAEKNELSIYEIDELKSKLDEAMSYL